MGGWGTSVNNTPIPSLATGRMSGRPGFTSKRTLAVGRFNLRPGKRSIATGRFNLRPGKRTLAVGRFNLRPGKRADLEGGECSEESVQQAAQEMQMLMEQVELYSQYLKSCGPESMF